MSQARRGAEESLELGALVATARVRLTAAGGLIDNSRPTHDSVERTTCRGYRYVARLDAGGQFAFSGVYTEVTPYSRLVYTEMFEPTASGAVADDVPLIVTVTFEERDGKTHLVSHSLCPSKAVRDAIIATGMEHGMRESMDQLDELAATLAQSESRAAK